jgi:methionyl-tRNA formyltransferase
MANTNKLKIQNLKNIVFIGEHKSLKNLVKINDALNLRSLIITSPNQAKSIDKKLNYKVFKKLDKSFKNYISKEVNLKNTLFVSIKSRWIFNRDIIKNFFKNRLINYHPARLPLYRGGAPDSWRILNGDRIDCQLFHLVSKEIDSGPIIFFQTSLLPKDCKTPLDLQNYGSIQIIKLYESFIKILKKKKYFNTTKQAKYLNHYYPRLNTKINGWIDWTSDSSNLIRFINAFDEPHVGASTMYNSKRVYIKGAHLHGGEISNHNFFSGLITRNDSDWITVSTSDKNSILITQVINAKGKNIIDKVREGDRFNTPYQKIDRAISNRVKYGAN